MNDPSVHAWRSTVQRRLPIAAVLFGLWALVIEGRLFYLQVLQHEWLAARAAAQQSTRRPIPAPRGDILDRNGELLASSAYLPSIVANPQHITDVPQTVAALCAALDRCSAEEQRRITARLSDKTRQYERVRQHVTTHQAEAVAALDLDGISIEKEPKRLYPKRGLAAHVIGFVRTDQVALEGVERVYDHVIGGRDGQMFVLHDRTHSAFSTRVEREPTPGSTVELTIDQYLQHVVERELRAGVEENDAQGGAAIVMDPATGEILAMASYPTFNPNLFGRSPAEHRRNRAVHTVIEPGSTFKIVTMAAVLERGVARAHDVIDVAGGRIAVGPRDFIADTADYRALTLADVFAKSSNVGAIKVAWRLGAESLTEYARRFGFGQRASDQQFLAEASGSLWQPAGLKNSELARVSIGYQVSVTPLQLAAAVSSIANGGELLKPQIVRAIVTGGARQVIPRTVVNRTVTPEVAAQVTAMMEAVVDRGTGTMAQIPGYGVAAKTGTAEKWDGGYTDDHNSSFVGFVPSRKPAYTIVVVIDSPRGRHGHYGGPVAGPVFRRIAEVALRHGAIPPTINAPRPVLVSRERPAPEAGAAPRPGVIAARLQTERTPTTYPDLTGRSAREALQVLTRLGAQTQLYGTGIVAAQQPPAGSPVEAGVTARVWLSHPRPQRAAP